MNQSAVSKVWTFKSDSNPNKNYETLQYSNGSTSCNCMGWTRRVAADGTRSCKHTRLVDQGMADSECISTHSYEGPLSGVQQNIQTVQKVTGKQKKPELTQTTSARKILWK